MNTSNLNVCYQLFQSFVSKVISEFYLFVFAFLVLHFIFLSLLHFSFIFCSCFFPPSGSFLSMISFLRSYGKDGVMSLYICEAKWQLVERGIITNSSKTDCHKITWCCWFVGTSHIHETVWYLKTIYWFCGLLLGSISLLWGVSLEFKTSFISTLRKS